MYRYHKVVNYKYYCWGRVLLSLSNPVRLTLFGRDKSLRCFSCRILILVYVNLDGVRLAALKVTDSELPQACVSGRITPLAVT